MFEVGPFEYRFKKIEKNKNEIKKIFCLKKIIINPGDFVVITGSSGSGKSTLLKLLKGIIPEFSSGHLNGEIKFNNMPLSGESFQKNLRKILFLFQNPFNQLIYQNASEELTFSMENFQFSREQIKTRIKELDDYFKIKNLWNKETTKLSHGECQRLVLASLMAIEPEVLLLDEPTAFLDPVSRIEFYEWLSLHKGEKIIILVDHHLNEVLPFATKIIKVEDNGEVNLIDSNSAQLKKKIEKHTNLKFLKIDDSNQIELKVSNLSFFYNKNIFVFSDISFELQSKDIFVLMGANGVGKSTLFKSLAGLESPTSGQVQIFKNNKVISKENVINEVAFIFQNPETHFFYDTIDEELKEFTVTAKKELTSQFLKGVDLSRSPFLLSEGEKRRLSILITLSQDKNIYFFDEPTFGQDEDSISEIIGLLLYLRNLGKILLIISHDPIFIKALEAKVFSLSNGRLETEML